MISVTTTELCCFSSKAAIKEAQKVSLVAVQSDFMYIQKPGGRADVTMVSMWSLLC